MRVKQPHAILVFVFLFTLMSTPSLTWTKKADEKAKWAKKDIRDFSDSDMERLYEQWEEDDEPLEPDELPEHLRPPPAVPNFNFDKMGEFKPEDIMKMTKKGKTLMMFVNLDGNPTKQECETLTGIWQSSLRNNHIQAERYVIDDARAIYLFHDGAQAWEAKDFFIEQEGVEFVSLEGQDYPGKKSKSVKGKPMPDAKSKSKKEEL